MGHLAISFTTSYFIAHKSLFFTQFDLIVIKLALKQSKMNLKWKQWEKYKFKQEMKYFFPAVLVGRIVEPYLTLFGRTMG